MEQRQLRIRNAGHVSRHSWPRTFLKRSSKSLTASSRVVKFAADYRSQSLCVLCGPLRLCAEYESQIRRTEQGWSRSMLTCLNISNIDLIDVLTVEFDRNVTIIIGTRV